MDIQPKRPRIDIAHVELHPILERNIVSAEPLRACSANPGERLKDKGRNRRQNERGSKLKVQGTNKKKTEAGSQEKRGLWLLSAPKEGADRHQTNIIDGAVILAKIEKEPFDPSF